jgi:hypothetical protein
MVRAMRGQVVPAPTVHHGDDVIGRRVVTVGDIEQPGDYCGPIRGFTGDKLACLFLLPNAHVWRTV